MNVAPSIPLGLDFKNDVSWKWDCPYLMGVLNATPNSFFDGGQLIKSNVNSTGKLDDEVLRLKLEEMKAAKVDIVDIGGESTRPGAEEISEKEELARILPVIRRIKELSPEMLLSIDTRKVEVARVALAEGVDVVNDVSAGDASKNEMLHLVNECGVPIILMHMRGVPKTMQHEVGYDDVVGVVKRYFKEKLDFLSKLKFNMSKVIIDPGIGFGKLLDHNITLIRNLSKLKGLLMPILVGASRKTMIGDILSKPVEDRLFGSIGLHLAALQNGANLIRVHDVMAMRDAMTLYESCIYRPNEVKKITKLEFDSIR